MASLFVSSYNLVEQTRRVLRSIFIGEADESPRLSQLLRLAKPAVAQADPRRAEEPPLAHARPAAPLGHMTRQDLAALAAKAVGQRADVRSKSELPLWHAPEKDSPDSMGPDTQKEKPLRHMAQKAADRPPGKFSAWLHGEPPVHSEHEDPEAEESDFWTRVRHPNAAVRSVTAHTAGHLNPVFFARNEDGLNYVVKPHQDRSEHPPVDPFLAHFLGIMDPVDPEQHLWGSRHMATRRLASHLGIGHFVMPGDEDDIPRNIKQPGREKERLHNLDHYIGRRGFITKMVQTHPYGQHIGDWTRESLDKNIDPKEVMNGAILHLLTGHTDGHNHNIMVGKNPKTGKAHLVGIDNDMTFHSVRDLGRGRPERAIVPDDPGRGVVGDGKLKPLIRSSFLHPNGLLNYSRFIKRIPGYESGIIGTNYPPRARKTLEWIAKGKHTDPEMGLGLSKDDADQLQEYAVEMLTHGFEGALARRAQLKDDRHV